VGHVDVNRLGHVLPDGRQLLDEVSFRVGDGAKVALVGANGAGKTTLLRLVAGDEVPQTGTVTRSGGLGVMRQFVGSVRDSSSVRDLLVSVAPSRVRAAAGALEAAELAMMERDDEPAQLAYAHALVDWGDAGGYAAEVVWDTCCVQALGTPWDRAQWRAVTTLSGGEQKQLEIGRALLLQPRILLIDEPSIGLSPKITGEVLQLLRRLAADGTTVLMVEQNVRSGLKIADRALALDMGRLAIDRPAAELLHDPNLNRLFLGGGAHAAATGTGTR